ncbi:anti-sigma factor [Emticicia soli]|uniref:Anti-sigma factor n=1 Tax=Emticicia soli TaxID=2027878 RepID=A0ABW5J572_9BACT
MDTNREKELIKRYLNGDASPEEFWEVEQLLAEDPNFLKKFETTKGLNYIEKTVFEKNVNEEIDQYLEPIEEVAQKREIDNKPREDDRYKKEKIVFFTPRVLVGMAASLIIIAGLVYHFTAGQDKAPVLLTTLSAHERLDVIPTDGKNFASDDSTGIVGDVVVQLFQDKKLPSDTTKYIYIKDMDRPEADTLKVFFSDKAKLEMWQKAKELTIKYNETEDNYNLLIDKKKYILNLNTLETLK